MLAPVLIHGSKLTDSQKSMLKFRGMTDPVWVNCHSFYFIDGKPAGEDSGYYYPMCHSLEFLPD